MSQPWALVSSARSLDESRRTHDESAAGSEPEPCIAAGIDKSGTYDIETASGKATGNDESLTLCCVGVAVTSHQRDHDESPIAQSNDG